MVCRTAYLIHLPEVEEITEEKINGYIQPLVVPTFKVTLDFDFGPCCGWDFQTSHFATEAQAQEYVAYVLDNRHPWVRYDPDRIEG